MDKRVESLDVISPQRLSFLNKRLIIFELPPPATLRDQDAADLEILVATLKWRDSAGYTGPDEFGPLSGNRWHVVLRRCLDEGTIAARGRVAAELEYLVKLLEGAGTKRHGTERRWADILSRFIRDDHKVPVGRRSQEVRDQLLSQHYWLLRHIHPKLHEDDCSEKVGSVYADSGRSLSAARIKRIAKTKKNKESALKWIDEQINAQSNHEPDLVARALLATFEPLAADEKFLAGLF